MTSEEASLEYCSIVETARSRKWASSKYKIKGTIPEAVTEAHHVVPRCLGGTNAKSNIVVLTLDEHFRCHYLLCKMYPENSKILAAFNIMMSRSKTDSGVDYASLRAEFYRRREHLPEWTQEKREEQSKKLKEIYKSPVLRTKISEAVKQSDIDNPERLQKKKKALSDARNCPKTKAKHRQSMGRFWENNDSERKKCSERVKKQNKESPELKDKRVKGIISHAKHKSPEWVAKITAINKERANSPENISKSREKYKGSRFDNSRRVVNNLTGEVYPSLNQAALKLGMNYSTLKKYFYLNDPRCPVRAYTEEEK